MFPILFLRRLKCVLLLMVASTFVAQAETHEERVIRINEQFGAYYKELTARAACEDDFGKVTKQLCKAIEKALVDEPVTIHGQIFLMAIDLTNRIAGRYVDRKEMLDNLSSIGYKLELHGLADTAHVNIVFALGILEHARGDMQAARMWFDSTLAFREQGLELNVIAASAKLLGYINREEQRFSEAAESFKLAAQMLKDWDGLTEDVIDSRSAWASSFVEAGGDAKEALKESSAAFEDLLANEFLRTEWTFAYLVYLNHARVLVAAKRPEEALKVANDGLALCRLRNDEVSAAYTQLAIARLEFSLKNYQAAAKTTKAAIQVFEESHQENHLADGHELLELIYEHLGDLGQSLFHARELRRLKLKLGENSRLESLLTLQRDYRTAKAEHKAQLATEAAARAELERSRAASQRTTLLLAVSGVAVLLVLTIKRLRKRRREGDALEKEVVARTAQLAKQAQMLEAKTRSLEASNKELERFAYIASHDLKTPLRNVTSFLGLIDRRMPDLARPEIGEFVELAQSYARSMNSLVDDVLKFSQLNGNIDEISTVVDLRNLCTRIIDQQGQAQDGRVPTIVLLGGAKLYAPESFLRPLIFNLIDNSLKYNTAQQPRVTVELFDADGEITICVKDNGIGIAREYQEHIFEMFRRLHTRDEYEGTGLGLSSCRKIAERLGGHISIQSELGQGSTFTVTLPIRGQQQATVQLQGQAQREASLIG